MPGHVPARHNSGGHRFNGIALDLPAATQYLFKVEVRPAYRGQRIAAAMIGHAIEHFGVDQLKAIITTTDWTNQSFISSVRRQGFRKLGFASEFHFAGTCMYLMSDKFF
jgi:ribosomal protein S18 acetylase RimI-like enzyme